MDRDTLLGIVKTTVLATITTRLETRALVRLDLKRSTANAIARSVCDLFLTALPAGEFADEARRALQSDVIADVALRALNLTFEEDQF